MEVDRTNQQVTRIFISREEASLLRVKDPHLYDSAQTRIASDVGEIIHFPNDERGMRNLNKLEWLMRQGGHSIIDGLIAISRLKNKIK